MKILHVIPARFPVQGYGGTERVAYWVGKAQAEMGHEVHYLCEPGSSLDFATTHPIPEHEQIPQAIPDGMDIAHFYSTPNLELDIPFLVTIEGNGQAGERFHHNTVFVSRNHAERHGWTEYVYNGVDLAEFPLYAKKSDYALFLGKASWKVKNLKGAIKIAKAAKSKLHVGGGRAAFWHFHVTSHGIVDGERKLHLLQNANCLLNPIIWEEPFGIVNIEALACGTPVISTPRGSLPEIVTDSCGVIANSFDDLTAALQKVNSFSPESCRARVEEKFTHIHMAENYIHYYKKILSEGKLREGFPEASLDADPQEKICYEGYV